MSITTIEPSVSVSDKRAVYGDPDRANTQDHVFVLNFDNSQVMPWITDPGYGVGVAITDDYLAVTGSGIPYCVSDSVSRAGHKWWCKGKTSDACGYHIAAKRDGGELPKQCK